MDGASNKKIGYAEAALLTGLKRSTLCAKVSRREIPHYRLGGRLVVFDVDELKAWLESRRVSSR